MANDDNSNSNVNSIELIREHENLIKLEKVDNVYKITFIRHPDNRIDREFINAFNDLLNVIEDEWRSSRDADTLKYPSTSLIVSSTGYKFFSNGLHLEKCHRDSTFFEGLFDPFLTRLQNFPIPTIALVNGHAFAAGFTLALCCDYILGKHNGRGWLCMNENEFGSGIPNGMFKILKKKFNSWSLIRKTVLECHRYTHLQLFEMGIMDELYDESQLNNTGLEFAKSKSHLCNLGSYDLNKHLYSNL